MQLTEQMIEWIENKIETSINVEIDVFTKDLMKEFDLENKDKEDIFITVGDFLADKGVL